MFTAGKSVWYLLLAVSATAALLFTFAELTYDRYIFTQNSHSETEDDIALLSAETITALKNDARLHYALLGISETIAHTSIDLGQRMGLKAVHELGSSLKESVTELRKRDDVKIQTRGLLEDLGQATNGLLSRTGLNNTVGLGDVLKDLSKALTEGLAVPALFLGIGVGCVSHTYLQM